MLMKLRSLFVALTVLAAGSVSVVQLHARHHDHAHIAGPKGGRVLTQTAPHAEFWVRADRHVEVAFYDAQLKPMSPAERAVTAIAEKKSGRVRLEFENVGDRFVSKEALPEGDGYRVVVQIRETSEARTVNHRFDFIEAVCDECSRAEYACICDDHEGHAH